MLQTPDEANIERAVIELQDWMEAVVARRRKAKGPVMSDPDVTTLQRIAKLGEEFGEVSELVYKISAGKTVDPQRLREECLDVATAAALWAEYLRGRDGEAA